MKKGPLGSLTSPPPPFYPLSSNTTCHLDTWLLQPAANVSCSVTSAELQLLQENLKTVEYSLKSFRNKDLDTR